MAPVLMDLVTVDMLQATLAKALRERLITKSTKIILSSDEEGNQMHYMYGYSIDDQDISWDGDEMIETPKKDRHQVTITFWPGGEEIDE